MWESLGRGSVTQLVEQQILRVLDDGQLRPGDRLPPEREFALTLGVSRTTVREALGSLKAQGRVEIRHGQGVYVAQPQTTRELRSSLGRHEHTLEELFAMREVLEAPAAQWAAELQDLPRLAEVRKALETLNHAMDQNPHDFAELQQLDAAFHLTIVEAAGNRFLSQTLGVLQDMLAQGMETTLRVPGRLRKSRVDHERILNALISGDGPAARLAARRHVHAARQTALDQFRAEGLAGQE